MQPTNANRPTDLLDHIVDGKDDATRGVEQAQLWTPLIRLLVPFGAGLPGALAHRWPRASGSASRQSALAERSGRARCGSAAAGQWSPACARWRPRPRCGSFGFQPAEEHAHRAGPGVLRAADCLVLGTAAGSWRRGRRPETASDRPAPPAEPLHRFSGQLIAGPQILKLPLRLAQTIGLRQPIVRLDPVTRR